MFQENIEIIKYNKSAHTKEFTRYGNWVNGCSQSINCHDEKILAEVKGS